MLIDSGIIERVLGVCRLKFVRCGDFLTRERRRRKHVYHNPLVA
jgi:hypothetical protein